jgi:hypothetical protein
MLSRRFKILQPPFYCLLSLKTAQPRFLCSSLTPRFGKRAYTSPRTTNQEPRTKNQEPRTTNHEPRTKNQEPPPFYCLLSLKTAQPRFLCSSLTPRFGKRAYTSPEPRTKNQEPRTKNQEPRTTNHEPRTTNHEPRTSPILLPALAQVRAAALPLLLFDPSFWQTSLHLPPNQEPRTTNQEPRTPNQEPRTKNQEPPPIT